MRIDEPLEVLGEFPPMPAIRDTRWAPIEQDWDTEVRVIDPIPDHPTFTDDYQPAVPVESDAEPVARLRARDSWDDLHNTAVRRLRTAANLAQMQLYDLLEGCRKFHYHHDVTEVAAEANDRVTELLRLIDIHDPE